MKAKNFWRDKVQPTRVVEKVTEKAIKPVEKKKTLKDFFRR